jgi:putative peptidoglycan lipid II flippase
MATEFKKEDYAKAGFNNTAITFLAKALGYIWFMLVAYIFGTQTSTDIYYLGTSFVAACTGLFTILIISVFPPILIRLRTTVSVQESLDFASAVFTWLMAIALVIAVVIFMFPVEIFFKVSKYSAGVLIGNKPLLCYFAFIFFVTVGVEYMRVFIQSMGQFTVTALIALVQSFILILCLLTLSGKLHVESMALGTSLSLLVQLLLLIWYSYFKKLPIRISFAFNKYILEMLRVGLPIWIGQWITLAAIYYTDYAASGLQRGVLTAVTFSQKIYVLPMLILFNPLLEIINTVFSESYHFNKDLLRSRYLNVTRILLFILTPISMFLILYRWEIVHVLFVRGAFTDKDALITANCLGVYSLIIVSSCFLQINARIMFTLQKTGWTTVFGTAGFFLTIAATHFFVQWFGYWGIPLGKVVIELLYFVPYTTIFMYLYLRKMSLYDIILPFLQYFLLSLIIGGASYLLVHWILPYGLSLGFKSNIVYILCLVGAGSVSGACYFYCSKLFKIKEYDYIISALRSRFRIPLLKSDSAS